MRPALSSLFEGRRRRIFTHALPLGATAALAFFGGLRAGTAPQRADRAAARDFAAAWARGDWPAAYALLDAPSRGRVGLASFTALNTAARATATLLTAHPGQARRTAGRVQVGFVLRTRLWGQLRGVLTLPVHDAKVAWSRALVFPGLRAGERLSRRTSLPVRAALLARDGTPLARGSNRSSPVATTAAEVVGQLESPPAADVPRLLALGYPPATLVGSSGLERIFQARLVGRPGGELRAGLRILARTRPVPARAVRTSIDLDMERASITALAGRLGGAAAVDPRTGEVLALAGLAFSALQPPGSTFKIVTATGALEAQIVKPSTLFPIQTGAVLEGRTLSNANGEACGGSFAHAFAVSCNSVFAPLGAKLGGPRLVRAAQAFGFNAPVGITGAKTSTIPASSLADDLQTGSSAIGQGLVQATALQMTLVAATIAHGGRRPELTLLAGERHPAVRAVPAGIAKKVNALMRGVVTTGTGTAAVISGVSVAGKTGTAELDDTTGTTGGPVRQTDAWFVAFAPAGRPRVAAGMLLVEAGAGGAVAAPPVREILLSGLKRR